ncbi:MAG: c-type cytochrome [Armatimonadetes bacterium]|nr:c-type cytochrome [Armatimonadota bacterium]
MRVCAEFENHTAALNAHKALIDNGIAPQDIDIRSPYPLPEEPIPGHRSHKMIMRNVVRLMWLCGLLTGFTFISYTQWEWGAPFKTDGHPLIAVPITALIMYECGMLTAIWVNTFMFFMETFRYRELVPPLEEDMPVAMGYIALVVRGASADKAKGLLQHVGARNLVSYGFVLMLFMAANGCAVHNMRYQDVIKPTELAAELPPPESLPMPSEEELEYPPPEPMGYLTAGDPILYEELMAQSKARKDQAEQKRKAGDAAAARELEKQGRDLSKEAKKVAPEIYIEDAAVAQAMTTVANPVEPTQESVERGQALFRINCSQCHGLLGKGDGPVARFTYVEPKKIGTMEYTDRLTDGQFYYFIATGPVLMPEFGTKLSPREIWDIVNFLRALQQAP